MTRRTCSGLTRTYPRRTRDDFKCVALERVERVLAVRHGVDMRRGMAISIAARKAVGDDMSSKQTKKGHLESVQPGSTPRLPGEELDGVHADPGHHRVLFENDLVRVVEAVIHAGERTHLHTHPYPRVMYALSGSSFVRRDPSGMVIESSLLSDDAGEEGRVSWAGPTEMHTIENTGEKDLVVLTVEVLRADQGT